MPAWSPSSPQNEFQFLVGQPPREADGQTYIPCNSAQVRASNRTEVECPIAPDPCVFAIGPNSCQESASPAAHPLSTHWLAWCLAREAFGVDEHQPARVVLFATQVVERAIHLDAARLTAAASEREPRFPPERREVAEVAGEIRRTVSHECGAFDWTDVGAVPTRRRSEALRRDRRRGVQIFPNLDLSGLPTWCHEKHEPAPSTPQAWGVVSAVCGRHSSAEALTPRERRDAKLADHWFALSFLADMIAAWLSDRRGGASPLWCRSERDRFADSFALAVDSGTDERELRSFREQTVRGA